MTAYLWESAGPHTELEEIVECFSLNAVFCCDPRRFNGGCWTSFHPPEATVNLSLWKAGPLFLVWRCLLSSCSSSQLPSPPVSRKQLLVNDSISST